MIQGSRQRNFASDKCVKKMALAIKQLFQSAMQLTLFTLHHLIVLHQMHFVTHARTRQSMKIQILVL
jgi:hypothetical protein